jgi:hypothetical protein
MTPEEFHDLTKYSYEELNSALLFMQSTNLAKAMPYTKADVLAEIERRSTPVKEEIVQPKEEA